MAYAIVASKPGGTEVLNSISAGILPRGIAKKSSSSSHVQEYMILYLAKCYERLRQEEDNQSVHKKVIKSINQIII